MKRKLNILMLNYEFPPIGGGAANAHYHILKEYAKMPELKVDVLTSAQRPGFFEEEFAENVTIYKVGLHKKDLHYWRKSEVIEWLIKSRGVYRKLLKENDYNFVHAFSGFPSGYLCYKTRKRIPYIVSLRGSDVPGAHARLQLEYKLLAPLFKSIWRGAHLLVACSEGLRQRALRLTPEAQIDVIPNGVDLSIFSPSQAEHLKEKRRLITVGRLSATKRIDMLIETVEILNKKNFGVSLTIVGGGSLKTSLQKIAADKKLGNCIELKGRVEADAMGDLYRRHDIYISATMQEGMSNAMLEAMACGLPIVTTKCEGIEELIDENGVVVERADAGGIASGIEEIASDKSIYDKMTIAARKKAEGFSWRATSNAYIQLYNKLL
jgi:glycosyltransferase involved in cell wall biosynthesis